MLEIKVMYKSHSLSLSMELLSHSWVDISLISCYKWRCENCIFLLFLYLLVFVSEQESSGARISTFAALFFGLTGGRFSFFTFSYFLFLSFAHVCLFCLTYTYGKFIFSASKRKLNALNLQGGAARTFEQNNEKRE